MIDNGNKEHSSCYGAKSQSWVRGEIREDEEGVEGEVVEGTMKRLLD